MSDFDLGLVLRADGSQAVAAGDQVAKSLDQVSAANKRVGTTSREAASGSKELEAASTGVASASLNLSGVEGRLDAILKSILQNTLSAAKGHAALRDAVTAQSTASIGAIQSAVSLATAHKQVETDAHAEAAAEQKLAAAVSESARAAAAAELAQIKLAQAQESVGSGATQLEALFARVTSRADPASTAISRLKNELDEAKLAFDRGGISAHLFEAEQDRITQAAGKLYGPQLQANSVVKDGAAAADASAKAANRAAFGARNLGQQVGDFATQVSLGGSVVQAFSAQLGQTAYALSEMGGAAGKVGAFLTGPWGIALTVAALVAAPFISKLFEIGDAADKGKGKLDNMTAAIQRLSQAQGRATAADLGYAQADFLEKQAKTRQARELFEGSGNSLAGAQVRPKLRENLINAQQELSQSSAILEASRMRFDVSNRAREADKAADAAKKSAADGVRADKKAAAEAKAKDRAAKAAARKGAALSEYGSDASDTIDSILGRFDNTPTLVRQTNVEVAKLDDLIDDLGRKKPPNFKDLIADAQRAKAVVQDGVNKPFDEFIAQQQTEISNSRLIAQGRGDEVEAAKIILGLEKQIGPLTPERKDAVLATVQAMKAEERQLDILREKQQRYLTALGEIKDTIKGAVTGGIDGILDVPKRLLASFTKLQGDQLFDKLFGGVFRDLEDQIKGTSVVEDASARMGEAVDKASASILRLGDAAASVTGAGAGSVVTSGGLSGVSALANAIPGVSAGALGALFSAAGGGGAFGGAAASNDNGNEIVVNGRREKSAASLFSTAIGKVSEKIASIFTDPEKAKGIGTAIGGVAGKGLAGAATGALANSFLKPLGDALGFKTSQTGAQLGGAAGSILFGPVGGAIGGALGSIVGGLFKTTKKGYANDLSVSSDGSVDFTAGGNSASRQKVAGSLADSFGSSLAQIAQQLGGTLNSGLNLGSLGQKKDKFTFDATSGTSAGKMTFDSGEEAVAAALANAIATGAVGGISAAMTKALKSSTDVDKAVKEALKVQTVETLIGGIGAQLEKTFRDFDNQAADYVATAKKYGLDVLAVETETAKQRTALIETTLKNQVGGLQDFLTNLASGDLFEGSAADKRNALLAQIATTETDAKAGKDGAADQLATLYRNLIEGTRESFGTAGPEFASDRATGQSGAAAIIASEKERITQAANQQQAVVDAATKGNELTNETNDLLAVQNVKFDELSSALRAVFGLGPVSGTASLERTVSLAA